MRSLFTRTQETCFDGREVIELYISLCPHVEIDEKFRSVS
jgi:hypothetical protein